MKRIHRSRLVRRLRSSRACNVICKARSVHQHVGRVVQTLPCVTGAAVTGRNARAASMRTHASPAHMSVRCCHAYKVHTYHSTHPGTWQPRSIPTDDYGAHHVKSRIPDRMHMLQTSGTGRTICGCLACKVVVRRLAWPLKDSSSRSGGWTYRLG